MPADSHIHSLPAPALHCRYYTPAVMIPESVPLHCWPAPQPPAHCFWFRIPHYRCSTALWPRPAPTVRSPGGSWPPVQTRHTVPVSDSIRFQQQQSWSLRLQAAVFRSRAEPPGLQAGFLPHPPEFWHPAAPGVPRQAAVFRPPALSVRIPAVLWHPPVLILPPLFRIPDLPLPVPAPTHLLPAADGNPPVFHPPPLSLPDNALRSVHPEYSPPVPAPVLPGHRIPLYTQSAPWPLPQSDKPPYRLRS